MPLVIEDRVRETTIVTGTNDATLLGAVTGFQAFSVIGNGNTTYYTISDQSGGNWEVGLGTFSSAGPTLARTTVLSSSAGGAKVSFPAGTKDVFVTYPSEKAVYLDASGNITPSSVGPLTVSSLTDSGNLTFTGTGNRITGEMSTGTIANRVAFQTSTTNGTTVVTAIPNGTGTQSNFNVHNNSDPTNSSDFRFLINATEARLQAGNTGTGTLLPITMLTGGSERLRIDTSGNVGIGTSSPTAGYRLDVQAATAGALIKSTTGTNSSYLTCNNTGGDFYFAKDSSTGGVFNGAPYAAVLFSTGAYPMIFSTNGTERMRIDSSGNVAIGSTTFNQKFTIGGINASNNTNQNSIEFQDTNANPLFRLTGGRGANGNEGYGVFSTLTGGTMTERMRIDSSGNVGIGTSSPTEKLQVSGTILSKNTAGWSILGAEATDGTRSAVSQYIPFGTQTSTNPVWQVGHRFSANGNLAFWRYNGSSHLANDMTLDTSGNLGLGVTPSAWASGARVIEMGGTAPAYLAFNSTSNPYGFIYSNSYYNGTNNIYKISSFANAFGIGNGGAFQWYTAPSGTAGNTITFTQAMTLDASGNLGVGTSSPISNGAGYTTLTLNGSTSGVLEVVSNNVTKGQIYSNGTNIIYNAQAGAAHQWNTTGTERMRIDSSGNVGIGTSSPVSKFQVAGTVTAPTYDIPSGSGYNSFQMGADGTGTWYVYDKTNAAYRLNISNAGNVGIGTSTPTSTAGFIPRLQLTSAASTALVITNSTTTQQNIIGSDGAGLYIESAGNATGTSNFIVFRTASANSSYAATERMRIDSSGNLLVGKTAIDTSAAGGEIRATGFAAFTRSADIPLLVNRLTDDGILVSLRQASTEEGNISVSGTTVSYNGGHLARWSQLPDNTKDNTILKGTVLTNLDDMCVWTKDGEVLPNEQLNKMKVSDVEGDTNVAGVFVNWTRDEDCNSDDMNIAMTGDMIIRIADDVVVQKGDLLMSAGDGTAKPQGDDIVRSKTIAKVTSNYVTCTYADGSYCVPCVLMAC
jgi:hypothetical protein